MFDWNNDGKHNSLDDSFYNNVLNNERNNQDDNSIHNNSFFSCSSGIGTLILLCVIYAIIKLL